MEAVRMSALLEVRNLSRSFRTTLAVDDISFEVEEGELLGLMGPNGAGKSTLFNLVAGVLPPSAGEIVYDGKTVTGWKAHDMARVGIARTFQIPKPYRQLSVIENVMLSAFLREKSVAGARKLAAATLDDVGLGDFAGAPASSLTVGLLKRLEVARALVMRPRLVLFDEIMAGLTPTEVGSMTKFVAQLPSRGITVVWVEHVLYAIMKTATRMIVINRGKQIAEGTPAMMARDPAVIKAYLGEEIAIA
jgi:branched-chain amino acid transport system ATP-binding protein